MNSNNLYREIKRFLVENSKLILSVSLLAVIGFLTYQFVSYEGNLTEKTDDEEITISNELPEHIARFRFYVETSTEQHIGNANLFQMVLLSEDLVAEVEAATSTNIQEWLDSQEESNFSRTVEDPGAMGLTRDGSSETIVFKTRIGTEQESLEIAEAYYALLENDEIEFFQNKEVYLIEEPYLDIPLEAELSATYSSNEISEMFNKKIEEQDDELVDLALISQSFIALIAGLVFGVVIAYYKSQFSKHINYLFNYEVKQDDLYFLTNNKENLENVILNPVEAHRFVLSDDPVASGLIEIVTDASKNVVIDNSILKYFPFEQLDEVIIVMIEHHTSKEWYYEQREILKNYFDGTIKIVQVSSETIK